MTLNLSIPTLKTNRFIYPLRLVLILVSLTLILYYAIYLVFAVPYYGFTFIWRPDNVATVIGFDPYKDSPAAQDIRVGDIIKTIDGQPVRNSDWKPLFSTLKSSYEYTIQRGDQQFTFSVPVANISFGAVSERLTAGVVALIIWVIAALIILFAKAKNRDAWRVGLVFLAIAVSLAASEASLQGVPLARLGSEPFLPAVIVSFLSIALIPRSKPPMFPERIIFGVAYVVAALLGLALLWDIVYLSPRGISFELITGVSLYHHLLFAFLGVGGLTYMVVLAGRFSRLRQTRAGQQIRILLLFTSLAIIPGVFLTLIPMVLLDTNFMPWIFFIGLLSLIPAGYGFVIYRQKYLELDIFAFRALTLLLMALIFLAVYSVSLYLFRQQPDLRTLEPLPSYLALALAVVIVPFAGRPARQAINSLISGPQIPYDNTLTKFTALLADDPQIGPLRNVFSEMTEVLQVRQSSLMLLDDETQYFVCVANTRVETLKPVALNSLIPLPFESIRRSGNGSGKLSLLDSQNWAELLLFLSVGKNPVGLLLLGTPFPAGYFNARQVSFIHQVGSIMAVAIEAMRLFESSREMSRILMIIRDTERMQIAAQIHDDPLQRISVVMNNLAALEAQQSFTFTEISDALLFQRRILRDAANHLRDICAGLYTPALKQGIQLAIKDLARDYERQGQVKVELVVGVPDELYLPHKITTAIYHVFTESLNNVRKHAAATTVWIELTCQKSQLRLVVADDGIGNRLESSSIAALIRAHHFGIAGMYEWASTAQGQLTIHQRTGGGTVVDLLVPLDYLFDGERAIGASLEWEESNSLS